MRKEIRVAVNATVTNVACGFDIMGFATTKVAEVLTLKSTTTMGVEIVKISGDNGMLSKDPQMNTAGKALLSMSRALGLTLGLEVEIEKKMAFGSGLGSSAASAVGAVFALNELLELNLSKEELIIHALEGERLASKSIHADNVAPALYGGFTLIRGYDPLEIVEIETPEELYCTVIHPNIVINTSEARALLPREIPLCDAVTQWGNAAGLIAGLLKGDYGLISRSLKDVIIEPIRASLIPGFPKIKEEAIKNGALGCSISGSGPAIFALSSNSNIAKIVGEKMFKVLKETGLSGEWFVSKINREGPKILSYK